MLIETTFDHAQKQAKFPIEAAIRPLGRIKDICAASSVWACMLIKGLSAMKTAEILVRICHLPWKIGHGIGSEPFHKMILEFQSSR